MFPKNPQGDSYPDLYEEVAAGKYSIESVFGTPAPNMQPSFQRNRNAGPGNKRQEPSFVREVVRKRSFTRPGESQAPTPDTLFKPKF